MKMLVAGVFQMQGTGKSGNPYDFAQVNGLVPVENVKNDKMRKHGVGYDLSTIALDDTCLAQFKAF
ncbi:MAG: hypothetical protein HZC24_04325, partial [Rhodocyclales bacterium]|nr:hypothetical protein [Rhodocyclales bacterium]